VPLSTSQETNVECLIAFFYGNSDPNVYLGWETIVEQNFSVYDVDDSQCVTLAFLEFDDYAMKWWHKTVMDIGLNKSPNVVS